jgi:hypothetical protein
MEVPALLSDINPEERRNVQMKHTCPITDTLTYISISLEEVFSTSLANGEEKEHTLYM